MGSESPDVVLYDANGNALALANGAAVPTSSIIVAGSDGTNLRFMATDSSGRPIIIGAGVAGTPVGGVVSIQGVASGTVVPVSGTVTANAGTGNFTVVQATAANLNATVTGTVTANIGTTNGLALDTSVNGILVSQGSTTSGEKGPLIQGAVTTAAPTYTTAQTSPLSLTTGGLLRIDGVFPTGSAPPIADAIVISGLAAAGTVQVPQVDKIAGQSVNQMSVAATITSPQNAQAGLAAYPTAYGTLRVTNEPSSLFNDHFAGVALDTTNNWLTPSISGVGATYTVLNGTLTMTASTTASAYTAITSNPSFLPTGLGFLYLADIVQLEATAVTGQYRFWGFANLNGSPTSTTAVTDGVGFEQTTTGALAAVIYAGGTKIFSQTLTRINDGGYHRYGVITRSDLTLWYYEGIEIPVASVQYTTPNVEQLPISFIIINGATPSAAGTFKHSAVGVGVTTPDFIALADGTYPWRKTTVKPSYTPATTTDDALVVTISPNVSPTGRLPVTLGDPGTQDVFGQVIAAYRLSQISISFNVEAPSTLVTTTTSGGGTTSLGTGVGIFATGTATTADAKGVSFSTTTYDPHHEIYAAFTASFTTPTSSASFQRIGLYDTNNGFSVGYNGTTFGLWTRFNGVDTFTAQSSWNTDTLSGAVGSKFTNNGAITSLVKTNINFYRIRFGWLGIAPVIFEVLSPDGNFVIVHVVRYPNTQTTPSITNPNLPMTIEVSKTAADATNLAINTSCWAAGTTTPAQPNFSGVGTISALNGAVIIPTIGVSSLGFNITGTWSGTLTFQSNMDGINWVNDLVIDSNTGVFASSTTTNQSYQTGVATFRQFQVIATAWTSGTATVTYNVSSGVDVVTAQCIITDANGHGPAAVAPGNTAATVSQPALIVQISPNQPAIPVTTSPSTATTGVAFGRVHYGGSAGVLTAIRSTTYTEQTTNFTGSVKSSSANDTSAGTGARTVTITYYDQTGTGPLTETVTLNGTTAVNLVNTNHCFIEKMQVITVGSTGSNAGTITLFTGAAGTGTTVGTIAFGNIISGAGDNETQWAHHYVAASKTASFYTMIGGTTGNQTGIMFLKANSPLVASNTEAQVSDYLVTALNVSSISRILASPIKVTGFARVTMYIISNGTNTDFFGSFDYSEQ